MKKSELRKIIKEELRLVNEDGSVVLNGEILDAIDNMHSLFNKLKNNGAIPRASTRTLYSDFKPLYNTLNKISDIIMKRDNQ